MGMEENRAKPVDLFMCSVYIKVQFERAGLFAKDTSQVMYYSNFYAAVTRFNSSTFKLQSTRSAMNLKNGANSLSFSSDSMLT